MYIGTVPSTDSHIPTPTPPAVDAVAGPSNDGLLVIYMFSLLPTFC